MDVSGAGAGGGGSQDDDPMAAMLENSAKNKNIFINRYYESCCIDFTTTKLWNCFGDRLHTIQDDGVGAPSNEGNPDYAEVDSSGALLISNGKVQVSGTQQGPYATTTLVEPPPFSQVRKH